MSENSGNLAIPAESKIERERDKEKRKLRREKDRERDGGKKESRQIWRVRDTEGGKEKQQSGVNRDRHIKGEKYKKTVE